MMKRAHFRFLLWSGLLIFAGCGGSDPNLKNRPQVFPASGVVKYAGQPVEGATVSFLPQDPKLPAAYGKTDAQGRFRLKTFEVDDGAVPGEYSVTIQKYEIISSQANEDDPDYDPETAPAPPPPKSLLPEKYGKKQTSGLKETVSEGGKNEFPFELTD